MKKFKTIKKESIAELVEKKSKFIAHIYYIENIEQIKTYIKEINNQYYDAKHHVFAYVLKNKNR